MVYIIQSTSAGSQSNVTRASRTACGGLMGSLGKPMLRGRKPRHCRRRHPKVAIRGPESAELAISLRSFAARIVNLESLPRRFWPQTGVRGPFQFRRSRWRGMECQHVIICDAAIFFTAFVERPQSATLSLRIHGFHV